MKRRKSVSKHFLGMLLVMGITGVPLSAWGQDEETVFSEEETTGETPPVETPPEETPPEETPPQVEEPTTMPTSAPKKAKLGEDRASWKDIIVIPRKHFLKSGRFELAPHTGVTLNDNLIRHYVLGAEINYYMSDSLSIGVEGNFYQDQKLELYNLTPQQHWRVPTANRYLWSAGLNFSYVPVYGKFALFNRKLIFWEGWVSAGVGIGQSEVLPRDPQNDPFKNFLIQPNVGLGLRFFIFDWVALQFGLRDYIFLDKFEASNRPSGGVQSADAAKERAESQLINNVLVYGGVTFWLPLSFKYTTFR